MQHNSSAIFPPRGILWVLPVVILLAAASGWADKVVTRNGQSIEGIIVDENDYYVKIDVHGIVIPIYRERIKSVTKNSPDDNARSLLDHATEAMSRNDIATARTLVEHSKLLRVKDPIVIENLVKLDQQIAELERRGGTPEQRRKQAEQLFQAALQDYDKILVEEGNGLLIQALRTDPTYENAHLKINELMTQSHPDLLLAAEYFATVLWPDNMRSDSPVIALLPQIYTNLAERFDQTNDIEKAKTYIELMRKIAEALQAHPSWKEAGTPEQKIMMDRPVSNLLADLVRNNLDRKQYENALQKLQGWANPDQSSDLAALFARAQIGLGRYDEASKVLENASVHFPEITSLRLQANALKLMLQGVVAQKDGNVEDAIANYDKVYALRAGLFPEIIVAVGRRLAVLEAPRMETIYAANNAPWRAADIAVLVLSYNPGETERRRAAEILFNLISSTLPWRLDFVWRADGTPIALDKATLAKAAAKLGPALGVALDPASPFTITFTMDTKLKERTAPQIAQAAASGKPYDQIKLEKPDEVVALGFTVEASHPILGSMFRESWTANGLPDAVKTRRETAGDTAHQTAAPIYIKLGDMNAIAGFIDQDLGDYLTPAVTALPTKLRIPALQELLTKKAPATRTP